MISARGNAIRGDGRKISSSSTWPRPRSSRWRHSPRIRARPDVDRREDLLRLRPHGHAQPLRVRSARPRAVKQLTTSTEHDVRWPSAGDGGRIVYELGGELYVLDCGIGPVAGRSRSPLPPMPWPGGRRRVVVAPALIEDFALSPRGERALFVGRGDVFSAPIEKGAVRNLTRSSGSHDKAARWSPDGRKVAYISDATGEEELYLIDQEGTGKPEQLTKGGKAMRYRPDWSPDGKRLAFSDKDGKVFVLTLADRSVVQVADDARGQVRDYTWSPCGTHLAFSLSEPNEFAIHLHLERRPGESRGG